MSIQPLSFSRRACVLIAIAPVLATMFAGILAACSLGDLVGPRPAANPVTVVEAYLQKYQPGPLPRLFQTTYLYDRNGVLLAETFPEGRRTWVSLAAVSPHLVDATLATEDASFYSNGGIDLRRIAGAVLQNAGAQGVVSGASTITMQLARNLFLGPDQRYDQSLDRKIQEAGIAQELTGLYSKDEILEMYLNLLNYSNHSYGPEAAAQGYFGKSAAGLTLAEASLLAGIPQRPADLNPLADLPAAKARQRIVLDLMVRHGYLTAEQADAAHAEPLVFAAAAAGAAPANRAPHFVQYVLDTLGARLGQDYVRRGGLRVVTTLDLGLQERAQQIVADHVARLRAAHDLNNAALVALKPGTAEILAMVGSAAFYDAAIAGQVNVTTSPRQGGSAVKPLLYAAALDDNVLSPATVLWDLPVQYPQANGQRYEPHNYDRQFHGPVTVRTALANSYNVPAVKLLAGYGPERMVTRLRQMGISTLDQENGWYGLSLALGGSEVTLLDLTTAYHTFANGGRYLPPAAVRTLVDGQGQAQAPAPAGGGVPVVSPAAAFLVTDILADNAARTPAFGPDSPLNFQGPAAVKTGTTTGLRDNWTVGYTPFLVAGVWAGNSDGRPMQGATGVSGAAPIWRALLDAVAADPALLGVLDAPPDPAAWAFVPPAGVQRLAHCPPGLACPQEGEYFTDAWLAQTAGEPLRDSVAQGTFAPVYLEGGGRQIGACGGGAPAAGAAQALLRLPGSGGFPRGGLAGEGELAGGGAHAQAAAEPAQAVAGQLAQERAQALAWSLAAGAPLHLGACEGLEQNVAVLLPGDEGATPRLWVDQAAVIVP